MLLNPYRFVITLPPAAYATGGIPVVIGTSTTVSSTYTTPLPTGWQAGDLLIAITNSGPDVYATPAAPGWNQIPLTTGGTYDAIRAFWKIATAGEGSFIMSTGMSRCANSVTCIRGAAPWPVASWVEGTHASGSQQIASITTPTDKCLLLQAVSDAQDLATARASAWANTTYTPVELSDIGTAWNTGGGLAVARVEQATAGATGNTTFTWLNDSTGPTLNIVINPEQIDIPIPTPGAKPVVMTSAGSNTSVASWSIDIPAGTESGDMAILVVSTYSLYGGVPTAPSGWTQFGSGTVASPGTHARWFYRQIDGTEGASVGGNLTTNNMWGAVFTVLPVGSFVSGSAPEIVTSTTASAVFSHDCPAITPSWGESWNWVLSTMSYRLGSNAPLVAPNSTWAYSNMSNAGAASCVSEVYGTTASPGRYRLTSTSTAPCLMGTVAVRRPSTAPTTLAMMSGSPTSAVAQADFVVLPLPQNAVGDLLVVWSTKRGLTANMDTPAGWTKYGHQHNGQSEGAWFCKVSTGGEASVTLSSGTTSTHKAAFGAVVAAGTYAGIDQIEAATTGSGTATANADSPLLTPTWGRAETLWLAGCIVGDGTTVISGFPYTAWQITNRSNAFGAGANGAMCATYSTVASVDPAAFTSASATWTASTLAIKSSSAAPAPIVVRSASKASSASTASLSVAKPTGTIDGDVLIAFAASSANAPILSTGWTKRSENVSIAGSFAVFSKTAASEGASWNFTCSADRMSVQVVCVSGATAVEAFGAIPGTDSGDTGVAASVTTTSAGLLLGGFFNTAANSATVGPAGMTVIDTLHQNYQQLNVYSQALTIGGATGTRSALWTGGFIGSKTQALVAIK